LKIYLYLLLFAGSSNELYVAELGCVFDNRRQDKKFVQVATFKYPVPPHLAQGNLPWPLQEAKHGA